MSVKWRSKLDASCYHKLTLPSNLRAIAKQSVTQITTLWHVGIMSRREGKTEKDLRWANQGSTRNSSDETIFSNAVWTSQVFIMLKLLQAVVNTVWLRTIMNGWLKRDWIVESSPLRPVIPVQLLVLVLHLKWQLGKGRFGFVWLAV